MLREVYNPVCCFSTLSAETKAPSLVARWVDWWVSGRRIPDTWRHIDRSSRSPFEQTPLLETIKNDNCKRERVSCKKVW